MSCSVERAGCDFAVGANERLLVNAPDPSDRADVVRILRFQIARMLSLYLAVGLIGRALPFQYRELRLGEHNAFLGHFGFQRLQSKFTALRRVSQPDAAYPAG